MKLTKFAGRLAISTVAFSLMSLSVVAQGDKVGYEVIIKGKKRITLEFDGDGTLKGSNK